MRQKSLTERKSEKSFYVILFRRTVNVLLFSVIVNLFLIGFIHGAYKRKPELMFYSTNGVTAPVPLTPLSGPNMSSESLMPAEGNEEMETRELPNNI